MPSTLSDMGHRPTVLLGPKIGMFSGLVERLGFVDRTCGCKSVREVRWSSMIPSITLVSDTSNVRFASSFASVSTR